MSSILSQLDNAIKEAMKARDTARLETVRGIKTSVKNKEIELIRPVTEVEFYGLLNTMVKQRRDSIEQFKKGGRDDLADKEAGELKIIETFLPQALSPEEVNHLISDAISASKATGPKDMGAVMKLLKDQTAGRVDGKELSELVRSRLQSLA